MSEHSSVYMIGDLLEAGAIAPRISAPNKRQALSTISEIAARAFHLKASRVLDALQEREALGPTGVGYGVAIPHARVEGLERTHGIFARLSPAVDFGSVDDEPVDLVFALLSPVDGGADHLRALARVARAMRKAELRSHLRQARTVDAIRALLSRDPHATAA